MAVHATTHQVYVTHNGLSTVSIVDGQPGSVTENTIVGSIAVGAGPFGVTVNSSSNRAYVTRPGAQSLSIIDTVSNTVIDAVPGVPNGSASLAVIPALNRVYASDDGCKCVNVVQDVVDQTAPTTTASAGAYSFGTWTNAAAVPVTLTATDDPGGSGVKNITYSASGIIGGQTIPSTVQSGASANVVITAEGVTSVKFYATDNAGNIEQEQSVTVKIDRTAPTASCSASPSSLWPPNHKMVPVGVTVSVLDSLSGDGGFKLLSVTSNEPDNGLGDGDTAGDISDWAISTNDITGQLRAERSGTGSGRVYTLRYEARDGAGNTATTQCTVSVPVSRN